mmetsp:Transcript_13486/g.57069  ORF Transcript_13486/g.57069 Transcript_13486/m.57069 type:complete len:215 (-) Transcript_13486:426-1070(-)
MPRGGRWAERMPRGVSRFDDGVPRRPAGRLAGVPRASEASTGRGVHGEARGAAAGVLPRVRAVPARAGEEGEADAALSRVPVVGRAERGGAELGRVGGEAGSRGEAPPRATGDEGGRGGGEECRGCRRAPAARQELAAHQARGALSSVQPHHPGVFPGRQRGFALVGGVGVRVYEQERRANVPLPRRAAAGSGAAQEAEVREGGAAPAGEPRVR